MRWTFAPLLVALLSSTSAFCASASWGPSYEYTASEVRAATDSLLEAAITPLMFEPRATHESRVRKIFARVLRAAARYWPEARWHSLQLVILNEPIPELYATGGGKVVLSTRFLEDYSPTDDELAFILGHEIAHVFCEHQRVQLSEILKRNAPHQLPARYALEALQTEPLVRRQIWEMARVHEQVADRIGLAIAAHARFDPRRALNYFEKVRQREVSGLYETPHDGATVRDAALRVFAKRLMARRAPHAHCAA